jgi:Domain of unknown function (DUF6894)
MSRNGSNAPLRLRFYFVIRWPGGSLDDDNEGTELPDEEAALAYARRIIRELKDAGGYDDPGLTMIVQDATGNVARTIPF